MPNYDFICDEGHAFEAIVPSTEKVIDCRQEGCELKAERLPSAPGLSFKGPGFYHTDYRGKMPRKSTGLKPAPPGKALVIR
jgi:putative FmdB family regulatory protein